MKQLIIKEAEKQYWIEQMIFTKITKKNYEKKQEISTRELSEKEKNTKREYARNRYNMSEEKKTKTKNIEKIIVKLRRI